MVMWCPVSPVSLKGSGCYKRVQKQVVPDAADVPSQGPNEPMSLEQMLSHAARIHLCISAMGFWTHPTPRGLLLSGKPKWIFGFSMMFLCAGAACLERSSTQKHTAAQSVFSSFLQAKYVSIPSFSFSVLSVFLNHKAILFCSDTFWSDYSGKQVLWPPIRRSCFAKKGLGELGFCLLLSCPPMK